MLAVRNAFLNRRVVIKFWGQLPTVSKKLSTTRTKEARIPLNFWTSQFSDNLINNQKFNLRFCSTKNSIYNFFNFLPEIKLQQILCAKQKVARKVIVAQYSCAHTEKNFFYCLTIMERSVLQSPNTVVPIDLLYFYNSKKVKLILKQFSLFGNVSVYASADKLSFSAWFLQMRSKNLRCKTLNRIFFSFSQALN